MLANYTGDYLLTPNASVFKNIYRKDRTIVNAGVAYAWKPAVTFFCDVSNVFNEPQINYMYVESRPQRIIFNGPTLTFGVSGRF